MAAIDKMYLKDYYVFDEFRLWCLIHNPKLLKHFYHWNLTRKEWYNWKEDVYQSRKEMCDKIFDTNSTVERLKEKYEKIGFYASPEQLQDEVKSFLEEVEKLKHKDNYIENLTSLPTTNFSCKEDRYLLWHCPIKEVREYLIEQCGYKEKWYYKLFFKY